MKTLRTDYRQEFVEQVLMLLWRQWVLLGVAGHEEGLGEEDRVIDPEALLLVTSELARFDARLFDQVLNWLKEHAQFINIQRLKSLHQQHSLGNPRVLAAIAATLLGSKARLAKWQSIATMADEQTGEESLFRNADGTPWPCIGKGDPVFGKYGYFRSVYQARKDASAPQVQHPALLLVKLRALLGVNARAEILAALLTSPSRHPSALARRTGYLSRSVQDILNEMALSGHVVGERTRGSREKFFSLRPGDWDFLRTLQDADFARWMDWPLVFSLFQKTVEVLFATSGKLALTPALRLRHMLDDSWAALSEADVARYFAHSIHAPGSLFRETFLADLGRLSLGNG